jgi:hypothetical protein
MKIVGHATVRLAITLALAAFITFLVPPFIDRREYAPAVSTYVNNPTPENGAVLAHEYDKNSRLVLLTRLGVGSVLFVIMNIGWRYGSKHRKIGVQEPK